MKQFLQRIFSVGIKLFLGIVLGLVLASFYASQSDGVKQEVQKQFKKMFLENYNVVWEGTVDTIDLVSLSLHMSHVSITPVQDEQWSLYTDECSVSVSWLQLLLSQKISCHGYFKQMIMQQQQFDKSSKMFDFLGNLFAGDLPSLISFDLLTIVDGEIILDAGSHEVSWKYNAHISSEDDGMHIQVYFLDGGVLQQHTTICNNLFGNITMIIPSGRKMEDLFARVDCRINVIGLQDEQCFIVGDVYDGRGSFVMSNQDQSFMLQPCVIHLNKNNIPYHCVLNTDCNIIQKLGFQKLVTSDLYGKVSLAIQGHLHTGLQDWQGTIQVSDLRYKDTEIVQSAKIVCSATKQGYDTQLFINNNRLLQGNIVYNDHLDFEIYNSSALKIGLYGYWFIPINKAIFKGQLHSKDYTIFGSYDIHLQNDKLEKKSVIQGSYSFQDGLCKTEGSFDEKTYHCTVSCDKAVKFLELLCQENNKDLLVFKPRQENKNIIDGVIDFRFLKDCMPEKLKSIFSQDGQVTMNLQGQGNVYQADVHIQDTYIRIPGLYNVVHNFKASTQVDLLAKKLQVDDVHINLYEGDLRCSHGIIHYDTGYDISFAHVPLLLDNVLISWHKGIFGIVSGRLLFEKSLNTASKIRGLMLLQTAQLQGNIFSTQFQKKLFEKFDSSYTDQSVEHELDITVETKEEVYVKTSFLKAQGHIDLHIRGTTKHPKVAGSIDVTSGSLDFPYKPLDIVHGRISMLGHDMQDTMVEFVAKGKIKNYLISMRATGSMFDQQIKFESSPYLTEEQIVSLLMVGSADSSLSFVMPAFFMQRLKDIVFGPALSKSKLDVVFENLLRPLKHVRFFPDFTNQSGRGGMRGIFEIDFTNRLQARIDSDFTHLEDTLVEVDYAVTDDITIRGSRDKPSLYGGEVEMKWKFS